MTQEEVAILWKDANGWDVRGYTNTLEDLGRFARLVAAKEREALVNVATNDTSQERVDEMQKQRHEQEPFAYVNVEKRRLEFAHDYVKWDTPTTIKLDKIPLYTTPPQRPLVELTDTEIDAEANSILTSDPVQWWRRFARAVLAKSREMNT